MHKTEKLISELYRLVDDMHFGASLYGIVDTGIYKAFHDVLDIEDPEHRILFKDTYIQEYESVAPYIVSLEKESTFAKELIVKGYASTWLTFMVSRHDMPTLAYELRERINVYSQKHEKEIIFRFYDPRNLARYFKMLTTEEQETLFTDINGLFAHVDLEETHRLQLYTAQGTKEIMLEEEEV